VPTWPTIALGDPSSPALVFLHGFLGAGRDWLPVAQRLSERFYCLLPDLPGHGQNNLIPDNRRLSFAGLGRGLELTLRSLGVSQMHMVGYSLGGRAALYYALQRSSMVRSFVLESASPGLEGRQARRQRRETDEQRADDLETFGMAAFLDGWYRLPLFASLQQRPELLKSLKAGRQDGNAHLAARVVADLSPGRQPSLWGRLGELQMPVLLIAGELDPLYPATLQKAAKGIPFARMAVAPQAGHNIHLETPEWFVQQIEMFIGAR
jgi:2-succinyl-6-hydroxy-2,4-cyclohexadiene-1-carboxylate synthase